ncbi:MAG TPA: aminotransferase class V-fold PLP-dependent enzyme [Steroidobacteraceae bacterium]|nr:aminotransferase class V-fold PLP-dependent enzyme [Steroidobacteraceae bacterium]
MDFKALRARFPVLERKTYLNSGSYCALADTVKEAINQYMEDRLLVGANWDVWVMKNEAVRAAMARLLNARPDEIAVTASASAGINSLASALDFRRRRNKVIVSDFEFPTNAQIWHAQEPRGARVVHVPRAADGYIPLENFEKLIDEETQLVAVTYVCFRNGARLDIPGIVRLAHARGARVLLDCYQAVGAVGMDVRRLDVDFAVGGMLKYLLGTAGLGFMYVREELIPQLTPANSGWFAQADITAMDITANRPSPTARRFEAGTPAVVNCYAVEAGLKIINDIGTDAIEQRVRYLTGRCMDRLQEIGWPSITPRQDERRGPMICVRSSQVARLFEQLMRQDIVTSFRDDNLRATFHFYNDEQDVERLVAALREHRAKLS